MRDDSPTAAIEPPLRTWASNTRASPGEGDTDAVLRSLVRQGLGYPAEVPPPSGEPDFDWDSLFDLLWTHRLGGLVWPHLDPIAAALPASLQWIRHFRDVTTRMNVANLLTMRRVLPRLQSEGILAVAFKGPILQQMAYGSVFLRPASDLDILVRPIDFARAGRVLAGLDYALADVCRSLWWKAGLGEQHFRSALGSASTLDLHHRVQQPGCPLPRQPARFLSSSATVTLAGDTVRTLSHTHCVLLAAMSYVKALHHREPAARYAIDLVALTRGRTPAEWRQIETEAKLQGLKNTLALTVRAAILLLGADTVPAEPTSLVLRQTEDATLVRMTLRPTDPSIEWPRRRALLHALIDNKFDYPAGVAAMAGSDLLRQAAEGNRDRQLRRLLGA